MRTVVSLGIHILFLCLAIFSLDAVDAIPARYAPIVELLPFGLALASLALGIRFNRSQLIYSTILFTGVYVYAFWWGAQFSAQQHRLVVNSIALLLPLNVAVISFYSERGILTPVGIFRLSVILIQLIVISWLVYTKQPEWIALLNRSIFPALQVKLSFLGQPALLSILFSTILVTASYLAQANPFRSAVFGSMILALYALTLPTGQIGPIATLLSFALAFPLLTLIRESYRMAFIDELTDLPGRRAFRETLEKLGSKYVIAMVDVDHFKKFNDTYGHDAGDEVLRLLSSKLKGVTGGGKPFRYGGEEFCVVFSGSTLPDSKEHLEELRKAVADKKFALRKQERRKTKKRASNKPKNRQVRVTISIGYAERNDKNRRPWTVVKAADKALYRAKRKGRNCVSK